MKPDSLSFAASYSASASRYFAMSLADYYSGNKKESVWFETAMTDLTKAAADLGFDLVKRPAVDEATLEMYFSAASYSASASRYFAMSLADYYNGNKKESVWFETAMTDLTKAAAVLGFDLVKRPAVDESALSMHFSDGALPVTDKPGFDGRDNSSIDDNVWSR